MNLLKYGLGPTAFLQAIVMVALNLIGAFFSSGAGGVGISLILVLLMVIWFGFLAVLAYGAEQRRSRGLAILLACLEATVALVALFDLLHFTNAIGFITSLSDAVLALTVLFLAYHLARRGNARVSPRPRSRHTPHAARHR